MGAKCHLGKLRLLVPLQEWLYLSGPRGPLNKLSVYSVPAAMLRPRSTAAKKTDRVLPALDLNILVGGAR